jgi:hypothetical protein
VTTAPDLGQVRGKGEVDRRRTYLAVLGLEILVVAALWALGRYFGSI